MFIFGGDVNNAAYLAKHHCCPLCRRLVYWRKHPRPGKYTYGGVTDLDRNAKGVRSNPLLAVVALAWGIYRVLALHLGAVVRSTGRQGRSAAFEGKALLISFVDVASWQISVA